MKITKSAVILLAMVLLTAAQSSEKPAKKEISNTYTASCLVKVTTNPAVLPLNEFAVDYLMHSSGVAGRVGRRVLGISPDIASRLFEIEEIESIYPDSAGGAGIPPDYQPWASRYGTTTTSRETTRTSPTATGVRSPRPAATTPRAARTPTTSRRPPTRPRPARTTTVTQPLPSSAEQTILFRLQVVLPNDAKPAAEEFMIALIDNLRGALRGAFDEYRIKFNQKYDLAGDEAIRAENQLVDMQAKLRKISGSRDLSRPVILSNISDLRQKLQSAKMKRASDEKLCEATAKRIAEEQARRKKLVEDDPITRELKSILDVHKKRLESIALLVESGKAPPIELEDAREKIIRARIELAKRQEEVSNPPGSIVLSSLNNELADLSTEVVVAAEEIYSFEKQLKEAEELLEKADSYEVISLKADIAKQNLEETLLWHARLGRNARSIQPPDVTVIGAE